MRCEAEEVAMAVLAVLAVWWLVVVVWLAGDGSERNTTVTPNSTRLGVAQ